MLMSTGAVGVIGGDDDTDYDDNIFGGSIIARLRRQFADLEGVSNNDTFITTQIDTADDVEQQDDHSVTDKPHTEWLAIIERETHAINQEIAIEPPTIHHTGIAPDITTHDASLQSLCTVSANTSTTAVHPSTSDLLQLDDDIFHLDSDSHEHGDNDKIDTDNDQNDEDDVAQRNDKTDELDNARTVRLSEVASSVSSDVHNPPSPLPADVRTSTSASESYALPLSIPLVVPVLDPSLSQRDREYAAAELEKVAAECARREEEAEAAKKAFEKRRQLHIAMFQQRWREEEERRKYVAANAEKVRAEQLQRERSRMKHMDTVSHNERRHRQQVIAEQRKRAEEARIAEEERLRFEEAVREQIRRAEEAELQRIERERKARIAAEVERRTRDREARALAEKQAEAEANRRALEEAARLRAETEAKLLEERTRALAVLEQKRREEMIRAEQVRQAEERIRLHQQQVAALIIQRYYRGHYCRHHQYHHIFIILTKRLAILQERRHDAARIIQALWRGVRIRKRINRIRESVWDDITDEQFDYGGVSEHFYQIEEPKWETEWNEIIQNNTNNNNNLMLHINNNNNNNKQMTQQNALSDVMPKSTGNASILSRTLPLSNKLPATSESMHQILPSKSSSVYAALSSSSSSTSSQPTAALALSPPSSDSVKPLASLSAICAAWGINDERTAAAILQKQLKLRKMKSKNKILNSEERLAKILKNVRLDDTTTNVSRNTNNNMISTSTAVTDRLYPNPSPRTSNSHVMHIDGWMMQAEEKEETMHVPSSHVARTNLLQRQTVLQSAASPQHPPHHHSQSHRTLSDTAVERQRPLSSSTVIDATSSRSLLSQSHTRAVSTMSTTSSPHTSIHSVASSSSPSTASSSPMLHVAPLAARSIQDRIGHPTNKNLRVTKRSSAAAPAWTKSTWD